jgi:transcriptional repressor NF-X1
MHACDKPCHPPSSTPPPCPRSPSLTTHCSCGKHLISPSSASSFPSNAVLTRTSCSDPIPNCTSTCLMPMEGCSHACSSKCHAGSCPPCVIKVVRPCRCGATTRDVPCFSLRSQSDSPTEILCDKSCQALRACGRHQCNRVCCPLASLAGVKGKGKKRQVVDDALLDEGGFHECDLVCGKILGCGNHRCEKADHRGPCPPCLMSSFEEVSLLIYRPISLNQTGCTSQMTCHCNLTILDPPIPCGTRINCNHPCSRSPPPCGHPHTQHTCHEDPALCPPCPHLTTKSCACGKNLVGNIRCSQENVHCGVPCGKYVFQYQASVGLWELISVLFLDYWRADSIVAKLFATAVIVASAPQYVINPVNYGEVTHISPA